MPKYIKFFLYPLILLIVFGLALLLIYEHGFFVLWLNKHHTAASDFFFQYWTYFGDGRVVPVFFLVLFFFKRRHAYVVGLLGIALAAVSAFLKKVVFGKVPRPAEYFEGDEVLNFVEGVKIHHWYSFPSGHTMTAFVLAFFLVLVLRNSFWSFILLFIACLVGISRVYLNQHFLVDILAGAGIGLVLTGGFYYVFRHYLRNDFPSKQ